MTTLNGLLKSWDSFICERGGKKKLIKFNRLWEECTQKEARLVSREEKMGANDNNSCKEGPKQGGSTSQKA